MSLNPLVAETGNRGAVALSAHTTDAAIAKAALPRIDELDGLRGILAMWVVLVHVIGWCGLSLEIFNPPVSVERLWVEAVQGAVDAFIILSGFVISYLLHARPQTYRQFMIGRFFRIYPVYFVCLLFGWCMIGPVSYLLDHVAWRDTNYFQWWIVPAATAQAAHPIAHLLAHLTLLFGMIPDRILPGAPVTLLGPAWSITLEWQYYLVAPLLARWVCSRSGLLLVGLVCSCDFMFVHFWSTSFLPIKLPLFLVGIGSFHLYSKAPGWRLNPRLVATSVAITLAAVIIISWHWIPLGLWTLVLGCLLLEPVENGDAGERGLNRLRRLLMHTVLQWLGKISYPIYLVHWPLLILLLLGIVRVRPETTSLAAFGILLAIGVPVILLTAWLIHKWIESPLMRFGKRFTR